MKTRLGELIIAIADDHQIERDILGAIIYKESSGNPWAHRYEPSFYVRHIATLTRETLSGYVPDSIPNLATEKRDRAYSYGLCQILGETARSILHFDGQNLSALFQPELNVILGCEYLIHLEHRFKEEPDDKERLKLVIKSYNGTGPQAEEYRDAILKIAETGEWTSMVNNLV